MQEVKLFMGRDGTWVTNKELLAALDSVGAYDCRVLYMHTELSFGKMNPALSRVQMLDLLCETIFALAVPSLCVPTFTFSFCNDEDYDVQHSKSKMGALNEHIRKMSNAMRSVDPLMSSTIIGEDKDLVENLGRKSIGADSTFDKLHHRKGVKFLFLGASLSNYFTYTHYVEERSNVPYRYNREFSGLITNGATTYGDTYTLFVRYWNVVPATDGRLEKYLAEKGLLRKVGYGDGTISCVNEPAAYETIESQLRENVDCYLASPYPREKLDQHFEAHHMVAL